MTDRIKIVESQQNLAGQQEGQSSCFSSKEAIAFFDTNFAKFLLLAELLQIQEFTELWREAREIPGKVMEAIRPKLEEISASLSPEARGALFSIGGTAFGLSDKDVQDEAQLAVAKLKFLEDVTNDFLRKEGIDYLPRLEVIVKPLGVPNLVYFMMTWDMKEWGIDRILAGPVAGPTRDLLESTFIRELTDLSPVEAMSETRAKINRRITRKISPLSRHIKQYKLAQRVHMWLRNVVLGETIAKIANEIEDAKPAGNKKEPSDWVKKQIRDASKILEVKRPPGRPRKGGVLRQWKLMAK